MQTANATLGQGLAGHRMVGAPADAAIDARRYVIVRELGRGGMGRVSIAEDTVLGRTVAIKELLCPRPDLVARFRRELALTARLQHPSIVSVHDGGVWQTGELAYVMRLVRGASLGDLLAATTTMADRVALLPHAIAVVDALAYAHSQQIIHRDLKPSNILIGDFGETVVIDWGLAKDLSSGERSAPPDSAPRSSRPEETEAGAVVGTPAYMPPEQARGEAVDERTDVYALGAVLYHMLAGVPPLEGASMEAVLVELLDGRIVPLRQRAPGLPSDLLAIVGKAMAARPEDRYANAGELAIDLKRFQRGQLVVARRYSAWQRARRWLGRHSAVMAVAAVAAVVIGGIGVAGVTSLVRERTRAATAEQLALTNRRDAEDLMDFMLVDLHRELQSVGKVDLMFGVASRARDYYDRKAIVDRRAILARENLADVLDDQGATRAALGEHLASLGLVETFAIAEPASTAWRHDLALAHRKAGSVLYQLGELTASVGEFRASCAAARSAADGDWQLEVEEADLGLAGAQRALGDAAGALATARGALVLATDRTRIDPSRRREVMVAENRVGDALHALGDHTGELAAYRAALAIADRLAADATDGAAQRDLALAYAHVGHALDSIGDHDNARNAFEVAEQLDRMLVLRDPANATWQRDLATTEDALAKR